MKNPLKLFAAALILIVITNFSLACPYCNSVFYNELISSRENTLIGQELLEAINNQNSSGSRSSFRDFSSVVTTPVSSTETPDPKTNHREFIDIIQRDNALPIPPTSYVPQNTPPTKKVSITLSEGEVYIGEGVLFKGFTVNGQIPGPTIIVDEGDVVEFTVVNSGKIPHGASIHAAYTQTSKYLGKIEAGATRGRFNTLLQIKRRGPLRHNGRGTCGRNDRRRWRGRIARWRDDRRRWHGRRVERRSRSRHRTL
jgi:hypothetical protein